MMPQHLFVYGTLRPQLARGEAQVLIAALKIVGSATVQGKLYDFGSYPGSQMRRDLCSETSFFSAAINNYIFWMRMRSATAVHPSLLVQLPLLEYLMVRRLLLGSTCFVVEQSPAC